MTNLNEILKANLEDLGPLNEELIEALENDRIDYEEAKKIARKYGDDIIKKLGL